MFTQRPDDLFFWWITRLEWRIELPFSTLIFPQKNNRITVFNNYMDYLRK